MIGLNLTSLIDRLLSLLAILSAIFDYMGSMRYHFEGRELLLNAYSCDFSPPRFVGTSYQSILEHHKRCVRKETMVMAHRLGYSRETINISTVSLSVITDPAQCFKLQVPVDRGCSSHVVMW
ncbi:hypothetical protein F4860DRAFT_372300 [Xylaria cubensis]|nr:hypothetical protein F4860DRAFT_372300 [Xylaria cubensis]